MPSIGVLEHFQKPTDKPTRRIKRSGGQSLVNRGIAYWIRENVLLQMIASHELMAGGDKLAKLPINSLYIPEKLPASIDGMLGLIVQAPVLPNQIRFRHV